MRQIAQDTNELAMEAQACYCLGRFFVSILSDSCTVAGIFFFRSDVFVNEPLQRCHQILHRTSTHCPAARWQNRWRKVHSYYYLVIFWSRVNYFHTSQGLKRALSPGDFEQQEDYCISHLIKPGAGKAPVKLLLIPLLLKYEDIDRYRQSVLQWSDH